jgi:23S rRNA (uracil1939-C5)-methyltransferase
MTQPKQMACQIVDLSHDGRGIGRIEGKTYFIEGALTGEEVEFSVVKEKRNFGQGRISKILVQSDLRKIPRCPYFSHCGGCILQHLDHNNQVEQKERQLLTSLDHAGISVPKPFESIIGPQWHYRRRARLAVRRNKQGQFLIGFRESGSKRIEVIEKCLVLDDSLDEILSQLSIVLQELPEFLNIIEIELVAAENAIAVAITANKMIGLEEANGIIKKLTSINAKSQLWWRDRNQSRYSCLSDVAESMFYLVDDSVKIHFEPGHFIQINRIVNQLMIDKMVQLFSLESKGTIVDLFCGSGNLSLPLAKYFDQVIGVEGLSFLVDKAIENACDNVIKNVQFITADLGKPNSLDGVSGMVNKVDAIILDPPRDGALAIMPWIANSGAEMVLYISCHPATMTRDLKILKQAGYKMAELGVLDMFPHTAHVESMSLLVK